MFALSIKNRRDDMIRRQAAKKLSSQSKRSTSTAINRPHAAVPVSTPPAINRSNSDNQLIFQNDDEMRTPAVLQTVGGRKSISVAGPQYTPKIDQLDLELIEISKKSTTIEHEKPKVIRRRATIHNYSPFLCLFRGRKKSKSRRKVASTNDKNALNNDQTFYSARENFSSNNERRQSTPRNSAAVEANIKNSDTKSADDSNDIAPQNSSFFTRFVRKFHYRQNTE